MGGNPVSLVEALDGRLGVADIHLLPHQTMGDAVEVSFHLDVVIDVHPGLLPLGILVRRFRQRQHGRPINLLEPALPASGQFSEGAVVQKDKTFTNGGIGFGQS